MAPSAGAVPKTASPSMLTTQLGRDLNEWTHELGNIEGKGSNNWVVDGSRTVSGKPLLANDPHLGLSAPAIWYFAHLKAPDVDGLRGMDAIGATLPGTPFVVLGRTPEVAWGKVLVRRHAGRIHLCRRGAAPGPACLPWPNPEMTLQLHHGRVVACAATGAGVRATSMEGGDVEIRLRRGGERLRPQGDRHTRELKKLLHASGMPPWQRAALPLVYVAGELVAVPGVCIAEGHAAAPGERGRLIRWLPDDDHPGGEHG